MSVQRRISASSGSSDAGSDDVRSPKSLQRSIWNQVMPSAPTTASPSSAISLRSLDLTLPPALPSILTHCQPHTPHIRALDVSYSILNPDTLHHLLSSLPYLEELLTVSCGLEDLDSAVQWPEGLRILDLSRNRLRSFPLGTDQLLYLEKVNLSGNLIREVDASILQLPNLNKLYLLNNPIANVPKVICREGVAKMRRYFEVEPLPPPPPFSDARQLPQLPPVRPRMRTLQFSESAESGYDSGAKLASSTSSSCSSLNNVGIDEEMEEADLPVWPQFSWEDLPGGYAEVCKEPLCQIFLPEGWRKRVDIKIVKDISLHPWTEPNQLLITPVVQISPHGFFFDSENPAIMVLSHCTRALDSAHQLVPLCSNTAPSQAPIWERLEPGNNCRVFQDCVMFTTTHFSLFAVLLVLPYPTAVAQISPEDGGTLSIPDFPGFSVHFPANCLTSHETCTFKATVYYTDLPYCPQNSQARASACVGLEPHGMHFTSPVQITLPIPDYTTIVSTFHDAHLQLWYAPFSSNGLFDWEMIDNAAISINEAPNGHTATFGVSHFSLFELLWSACRETVTRLGYGAGFLYRHLSSGASYVSVRCQVFMSPPLPDLSFGLLVTVYKFGEPLHSLSNYPWLLADTGSKHVFLRTGEVSVVLSGHFIPRGDLGESQELQREAMIDFSGQDFCLRFEFALRLMEDVGLPLQDHQLLGKLRVGPASGSAPIDLNLIKPSETNALCPPSTPRLSPQPVSSYMECTPPWTPENDLILSDHTTAVVGVMPMSDPTAARPGKRRRHANDPPGTSSSCSREVRAKRRLLVKEGRLGGDKFLMDVARGIGPKWEEVGIALGLDFGTIKSAVSDDSNRPEHMKAFYVLQEWKHRACDDFTHARLASALEEAGMHTCAQTHCYYSSGLTDHTHED